MNVKVRLFAVARQLAGAETVQIDLPRDATIAELRHHLAERFPELVRFGPQLRFAVNTEYAEDSTRIDENADVACIPPVSGG